jgi:hypothetical protein
MKRGQVMDWLSSLQTIPVAGAIFGFVFLLFTTFANGWKEKREGKKLGVDQERRRQEAASAKKDREIIERANDVKETSDAVRDTGDYSDERLPDETAAKLPDYHYRD